jgi:cytochrome b subunit of formate dehydrogenase
MEINRYLLKLNRISAWILLVFMIIFLISGYAWSNRTIMPLQLARYLHSQLDMYLVFFFLVHVLISTRFTLARWRVGHPRIVGVLLIAVGLMSFWLILSIR